MTIECVFLYAIICINHDPTCKKCKKSENKEAGSPGLIAGKPVDDIVVTYNTHTKGVYE